MAKRALKILGGGVAIAVLALGIGWFSRNGIIESALEGAIKDTTGVSTDVEGLNFQPFAGDLTIKAITLKNPQGFSTPHLVKVQNLDLDFQLSNLWQDQVDIEALTVNGLDLRVEQQIPDNNLVKVVDTLQEKDQPESSGNEKVVKIGRLSIRNIKASIKVTAIGDLGIEEDLDIDDIELTDVTSKNAEGKLSVAIANAVTTALLEKIPQDGLPIKLDGDNPLKNLPIDDIPIDDIPIDIGDLIP